VKSLKYTLKNRPNPKTDYVSVKTEKWFEGFEKELREILDIYKGKHYDTGFGKGREMLIKEILGE